MKTFDSKWFCSFIFLFFLYINQHHISSTLTAPVQEPGGWDRGEGGEEGGSPQLWSCFRFLCARQVDRLPSAYSHGSLALCVCVSRGVRVCDTWRVPPPSIPLSVLLLVLSVLTVPVLSSCLCLWLLSHKTRGQRFLIKSFWHLSTTVLFSTVGIDRSKYT